jgi:PhnB protein
MAAHVKPIPEGYHTVTTYLAVDNAAKAIDFYKQAFGATERARMDGPAGKIGHAELQIGDSILMLADEMPQSGCRAPKSLGGTTCNIFLYVQDVDAAFKKAVAAGAKVEMPVADMFWGDRYGKLSDPFGHSWSMATHKEDVAPAEMQKRMQAAMTNQGPPQTKKTAG